MQKKTKTQKKFTKYHSKTREDGENMWFCFVLDVHGVKNNYLHTKVKRSILYEKSKNRRKKAAVYGSAGFESPFAIKNAVTLTGNSIFW